MRTTLAMLGVAVVAAGCAHFMHSARQTTAPATAVLVQNNQSKPITVFADQGISEQKLGVVMPFSTIPLDIPRWMLAPDHPVVDFFVQPRSGTAQESGDVRLVPGKAVELVVPAH